MFKYNIYIQRLIHKSIISECALRNGEFHFTNLLIKKCFVYFKMFIL